MTMIRTTTLMSAALALVLAGCGGGATDDKKDAKGKTTTAKKDVKTDAKSKRDDKKVDTKKIDEKKGDEGPTPAEGGDDMPPPEDTAGENDLTDDKVVEVAQTAKELEAKPADADAILQSHGMDRDQFDAAMAAIAKDQWKSDLYIAAFTQAAKG